MSGSLRRVSNPVSAESAPLNHHSHCAPGREDHFRKTGTCLLPQEVDKLARYHKIQKSNASIEDVRKKYGAEVPDWELVLPPGKTIETIKDGDIGNGQIKYLDVWRPFRSQDKWYHNWLATDDIDLVLRQYHKQYPSFHFLGTHPIDFLPDERGVCSYPSCLRTPSISKLKKNEIQFFAVVLNTDDSTRPGEHWFCIFVDKRDASVSLFDSTGKGRDRLKWTHIERFLHFVKKVLCPKCTGGCGKCSDIILSVCANQVQKQPVSSGECGVYCTHFILSRLQSATTCPSAPPQPDKPWYTRGEWSSEHREADSTWCGHPNEIAFASHCTQNINAYNNYIKNQRTQFWNVYKKENGKLRVVSPEPSKGLVCAATKPERISFQKF